MRKDLGNLSSSRSLTHPTGNHGNKPPANGNHPELRKQEPASNHFGLNPVALSQDVALACQPTAVDHDFRAGYEGRLVGG